MEFKLTLPVGYQASVTEGQVIKPIDMKYWWPN